MILADKILTLRKQSGWSQEELARQLDVTRQSVSKWEGAQAVPDLEKILQMARLFGVSTDYLLKDELELPGPIEEEEQPAGVRRVSMEQANEFLAAKDQTALPVAAGASLCILSPVCLLLLGALSETDALPVSEAAAAGIGLTVLLALVAAAVALFISAGAKVRSFEYLETDPIETEYGVTGMVRRRQQQFQQHYTRGNMAGTMLCILCAVPIFAGMCLSEEDLWMVAMVCLTLALVAAGVFSFIMVGIPWGALQQLLQEGDYTRSKKADSRRRTAIATVYWLLATALYLGCSFIAGAWNRTWILWPVAGVLFAAVMVIDSLLQHRED